MAARPLAKGSTLMCSGSMKMWEGVRTEGQKRAKKLSTDWSKSTGNTRTTSQEPSDSWPQQTKTTLV